MGGLSIWHWLIVLVVVMLLFGTGKVSTLMGDVAKGIKQFKKNMNEEDASMEAASGKPMAGPPPPPMPVMSIGPVPGGQAHNAPTVAGEAHNAPTRSAEGV